MMMATNTPASNQITATEYSDFYQKVALGEIRDDEALVYIARVDVADRETVFENEACWPKSMPALGVTFPIENIRGKWPPRSISSRPRIRSSDYILASQSERPGFG
jgi:phage terminase large subunit-like protein